MPVFVLSNLSFDNVCVLVFPFLWDSSLRLLIGKLNHQVLCHILKNNLLVNLNRYQEIVNWLVVIKRIEILLLLFFTLRRYKDGSGLLLFPFLFSNKKERNLKLVNNLVNLYAPGKRLLSLGLRKKHIFAVVVLSFFLSIYIYIKGGIDSLWLWVSRLSARQFLCA